MKGYILALTLCFISFIVIGQNAVVNYTQIAEGKSAQELTGHNSGRLIQSYTASNGITYTKGIEIELGEPSNGNKFYTCLKYGFENVRSDNGTKLTIDKIYCLPARKAKGCRIRIDFTNGAYIEDFEPAIESKELNIEERIITIAQKQPETELNAETIEEPADTAGVIIVYPTAWRRSVIDCTQFTDEKKPFLISKSHWEDWDAGMFMHKAQGARWIGVGTSMLLGTVSAICYVAGAEPAGQWFAISSGVCGLVGFVVSEIRLHAASHKMSRIGLNPNGISIKLNK
ncbi:MAG: hypothetical protein J5709_10425 [Bacteroidales bacterium]|nr:hypothetical protein [Bacteroidales bacterium]